MSRLLKMKNNNRKRVGNEIPMARDELDCMQSTIFSQEEQQKEKQENVNIIQKQWQRHLSPLKRRPSFFGRAGTSSSSASPQRRLSPERSWWPPLLFPLLSKASTNGNEKYDENGSNSLLEAWESLKNGGGNNTRKTKSNVQSEVDINGYVKTQLQDKNTIQNRISPDNRLSSSSQKYSTSTFVSTQKNVSNLLNSELPPKSISSKSLKSSEMNYFNKTASNNGFIQDGQHISRPQPKPRQRLKQEKQNAVQQQSKVQQQSTTMYNNNQNQQNLVLKHENDEDESMSTSILASAAWYRDNKGRTGYRPQLLSSEELLSSSGSRIQNSPVKLLSTKTQSLVDSVLETSDENSDLSHINNTNNPQFLTIRHTTTHPNTLFDDQTFSHNNKRRGVYSSPPRMLRRTNKSKELILTHKDEENYLTKNYLNNSPIEEMERLAEQLLLSKSGYQQQQPQKMVKFAETVEINEIEKFEGSSISSNNSCDSSFSPASNSSTLNPFENINDSLINEEIPEKIGKDSKKDGKQEKKLINGTTKLKKEERSSSLTNNDSQDVCQVIEQFFNHCHSLSSMDKQQSNQHFKEQKSALFNNDDDCSYLFSTPPIEQRSFYDNMDNDEKNEEEQEDKKQISNSTIQRVKIEKEEQPSSSNNNWFYTKTKVIAQQNCGPLVWRRDGSPLRRVQMLITCDNKKSENIVNQQEHGHDNIKSLSRGSIPLTKSSVITSNNFIKQPPPTSLSTTISTNNTLTKHLPRQNNLINGNVAEGRRNNKKIKHPSFIITTKNTQNWPPNF